MQNNKVVETAYLLRQNKANINNIVCIDIIKKYTIKCNGVKKTSNAKKTTSHKLETQINVYSNLIGDLSVNAQLKKQVYASKRSEARKKLKAR